MGDPIHTSFKVSSVFGGFYFAYFAFLGLFAPYFALYLSHKGYSTLEIAFLIAIGPASRVVGPYLWGFFADRFDRRNFLIRILLSSAFLVFAVLYLDTIFIYLFCLLLFFHTLLSGVLPLFESATLEYLKDESHKYGLIRLWGSVGFALAVILGGVIFQESGLDAFVSLTHICIFFAWICLWWVPDQAPVKNTKLYVPTLFYFSEPGVKCLFLAFFFMQLSHGPFNTFYSIYLVEAGYSKSSVGLFWAVGVIAEIVLFIYLPYILKWWSLKTILNVSVAAAILRFIMIGWGVESTVVLFIAQLMHAVTFGAFHVAGLMAVHRLFGANANSRGQALYSSLGYGAGGGLGAILAGLGWDQVSGEWVFTGASAMAILSLLAIRNAKVL